ncbi:MAG: TraR/DksA family transcriptional regulator [Actinomycetota bacterium]
MSSSDVENTRSRLAEERRRLDRLAASLGESIAQSDELSSVDQHPADLGTETFEQTKEDSIRRQVDEQLAEVRRAQARVEDGTYGLCEACGRPIGTERLVARPNARFCVDDQRAAERERDRAERAS